MPQAVLIGVAFGAENATWLKASTNPPRGSTFMRALMRVFSMAKRFQLLIASSQTMPKLYGFHSCGGDLAHSVDKIGIS
jgi:hypothetical protein